jgi:hypothetical protein
MPRRHGKNQDGNHAEIRDYWRSLPGWHVEESSQIGGGWPDLVAVRPGRVVFAEVKNPKKGPKARALTPDEQKWHARMIAAGAEVVVVEHLNDVDRVVRAW